MEPETSLFEKQELVKLQRPHTTSPHDVAEEGKSPYFREIWVGEIL